MTAVRLEPLDLVAHQELARALESAALATVVAAAGEGTHDDDRYYVLHARRAGFRALAAWAGDELVGFGYGYDQRPGSWWDEWVRPALTAHGEQALLADAFELVELHVAPSWHGQGLGRRLLTELLDGVRQPRALLTTQGGANPARAFYRALGARELAEVRHGEVPFVVLALELPLTR